MPSVLFLLAAAAHSGNPNSRKRSQDIINTDEPLYNVNLELLLGITLNILLAMGRIFIYGGTQGPLVKKYGFRIIIESGLPTTSKLAQVFNGLNGNDQ